LEVGYGWTADPRRDLHRAWNLASEAQAMENKPRLVTWLGHWAMAWLYQWYEEDFVRSVAEAEAAVQMVPYDAGSRADLAKYVGNAGNTDEAITWAKEALRLDPKGPEYFRWNLGFALYLAGRPEDALTEFKKVSPPWRAPNLAATYARLGRIDEARAVIAEFRKGLPNYTLRDEANFPAGKEPQLVEPLQSAYLNDLRKAGMPE
jgi:Flp pilus assembly protein TadD